MIFDVYREKKQQPLVKVTLKKTDMNLNAISNTATVKIECIDNATFSDNATSITTTIGIKKITVKPQSSEKGYFKLKITETSSPTGYKRLLDPVILTINYNTNGQITEISVDKYKEYFNLNKDTATITLKNEERQEINNLKIIKTDSSGNNRLQGVEFQVYLYNVESVKINNNIYKIEDLAFEKSIAIENSDISLYRPNNNGDIKRIIINGLITDENGEINAIQSVKASTTNTVYYTITEISTPEGYEKLPAKLSLTLNYKDNKWTLNERQNDPYENNALDGKYFSLDKDQLVLTLKNEVKKVITLSGTVWQDGQTGVKNPQLPNGKIDEAENKLQGVTVYLYNQDGKLVSTTNTNAVGYYEFKDMPQDGYYVVFEYNGIKYTNTPIADEDSKASEENAIRSNFNKRFTTITKTASNDGTRLLYSYKDGKSVLRADIDGTNHAEKAPGNDNTFKMQAKTNVYTETTENVNYGLVERYFDLAVGMDIDSAKLTINGKETTYNYNQILDGDLSDIKLDELLDKNTSTNSDLIYNLYLYYSDYNYRISDYVTENAIQNNNAENDIDKFANNRDIDKELKAFVTYKVIITNQSTNSAKVNELAYYYDQNYTFVSATNAEGKPITFNDNDTTIPRIEGKNVARVSEFANNLSSDNNYRQELYFTFEVKKSEDGTRALPKDITCANIVEILSYSTNEGLIDNDSCPGNVAEGCNEDDTDEAQGINIKVKDEQRKIAGTVFDDGNKKSGDGILNENEKGINDVIVQLIEVKKINDKYYEYIWQETRSGSNIVKTTARNGYSGTEYINDVKNDGQGQYEFTDFIPANYIIRFIYGDGSTYDITSEKYKNSALNVQTYNGQDYQSTIDSKYNSEWYSAKNYVEGSSIARDNEARRLSVMAYSTIIDNGKATELEQKSKEMLQNTWMAAETSRINVPIDAEDNSTTDNSTTVSFKYIANSIKFDNMNFGLAKRPETKLVLEKHITALKITPNGTGVQPIVDASAKIEDVLKNSAITTSGSTSGLSTMKSTRDDRGFWKVETDVEELAQGATLEVEYTYVIKNESEDDYLSVFLVNAYKDDYNGNQTEAQNSYEELLEAKENEIKKVTKGNTHIYGTYLGQYYYTGHKGDNDTLIPSQVETLEEALNNDLKYNKDTAGNSFKTINSNQDKSYIDTDGNLVIDGKEIETIIQNEDKFNVLSKDETDYSKTLKLTTVLSSVTNGEIGGTYPSYLAEITQYSNAAGRRNMEATPANLIYVHSDDTEVTLDNSWIKDGITYVTQNSTKPEGAKKLNEDDEFWGESIIITKPTGTDKTIVIQIAIIVLSGIAVIGVGIVLIKKFVLKN
ncbi:MAG: SdrD B-like domain-containing protein [Clostridia bacterium]|nr:SdrD B-like domain-containing protein [Clostridia bacterium]